MCVGVCAPISCASSISQEWNSKSLFSSVDGANAQAAFHIDYWNKELGTQTHLQLCKFVCVCVCVCVFLGILFSCGFDQAWHSASHFSS